MTNIEIEHETTSDIHTEEQSEDELVDTAVKANDSDTHEQPNEQPLQELNKPVKQLTKAERELIINEFNNGGDNKYYKVHKLKNGSIRITKRSNPLTNNAEDVQFILDKQEDAYANFDA